MLNLLKNEPLRVRLYSLSVLVSGYLLAKNVIDATDATFIGAVALVVLGVEAARSKVVPARKLDPDLLATRNRTTPVPVDVDPVPDQG